MPKYKPFEEISILRVPVEQVWVLKACMSVIFFYACLSYDPYEQGYLKENFNVYCYVIGIILYFGDFIGRLHVL